MIKKATQGRATRAAGAKRSAKTPRHAADLQEQCTYVCGPYKGYNGRATYDHDAEIFHGDVAGTRDVITFEGTTIKELHAAFVESVDDYLDFCRERGKVPEKPFSGKFLTRIEPELHRKLSAIAEMSGKSLNQFICDRLEEIATERGAALPEAKGAFDPTTKSRPAILIRRRSRSAPATSSPARRSARSSARR